jgi:3,4-dihydroxy 2-butanone 4-phosphate synthase/GTP cyclohydrolase II
MAVLIDEEDRENEGDLIFAADFVTAEKINFLATHGRGLICMPITAAHAERLNLAPMVAQNRSVHGTNFTVSIEAAHGVATGISAKDRAHTIRVAAAPDAKPSDIVQPGHVFPLIAQPGGVLARAGHTEACCDLAALAGLTPAAVLCEIMNADGTMARLPDLLVFAKAHGLKIGTIADLISHRRPSGSSSALRSGRSRRRTGRSALSSIATSSPMRRISRSSGDRFPRTPKPWCACTSRCR